MKTRFQLEIRRGGHQLLESPPRPSKRTMTTVSLTMPHGVDSLTHFQDLPTAEWHTPLDSEVLTRQTSKPKSWHMKLDDIFNQTIIQAAPIAVYISL